MTYASDLKDFETKLAAFPAVGLLGGPTPFTYLKRLSEHLGGPKIWVKRDDATHISSGGNKMRKLDRVLSEAVASGCDCLVSGGVPQSNSQRQVAAAAVMLGMECHLAVYQGRVVSDSAAYKVSGNVVLNRLFGAHMHSVTWVGSRNAAIEGLADELRAAGKRPFAIPYGVSNAMGALSYSSVVLEIAQQSAELGFTPRAIFASSGSGGTQSGLEVGAAACLPQTDIIGVDVDADPERVKEDVVRYGVEAAALLGSRFDPANVRVTTGYAGPAYGVPHAETLDAMRLAGRLEAMILDPVYTGKAFAALIGFIRDGQYSKDDNVVFIHTGGMPATFAYAEFFDVDAESP